MRPLIAKTCLTFFLVCLSPFVFGAEYYVSNTGNDANSGTIDSPFKTVAKLLNVIQPGDVGFLRGGTYALNQYSKRSGTEGAPITIKAYNDEKPVLKGSGQTSNGGYFHLQHDWYVFENIDFYQGNAGVSIQSGSHNKIMHCKAHSHYFTGFVISGDGASYNQFVNCDAFDMYDSGTNGNNADGIVVTGHTTTPGPGNEFIGCRSFNNSDDGFDVWRAAYPVRMTDCMAFNNGNHDGDGNGFKLGINKTKNDKHVVIRCLSWGNRNRGFDYNDTSLSQTLYNCIAYNNRQNYKFGNINGGPEVHDLQNCISVVAPVADYLLQSIMDQKTNSWNYINRNAANIMENNFLSTDDSVIKGARNADGTIPDSDFLKLKPGSVFIDAGVDVGLAYNDAAPDLGPFESGDSDNHVGRIGIDTIYDTTTTSSPARATGPFTVSESCAVKSLSVYHEGDNGDGYTLELAVYSDNSGVPGTKLGTTGIVQVNGSAGWQTVPLQSNVQASSGQEIWLAWKFSVNPGLRYVSLPGNPMRYDEANDSLENTFVPGASTSAEYSLYATYSTLISNYDSWVLSKFTPEEILAGDSSATADPDHDGFDNNYEYFFNMNPKDARNIRAPKAAIVVDGGKDYPAITYTRHPAASGVTYVLKTSTDLATWTDSTEIMLPVGSVIKNPDGSETVTVRYNQDFSAISRFFIKIEASE